MKRSASLRNFRKSRQARNRVYLSLGLLLFLLAGVLLLVQGHRDYRSRANETVLSCDESTQQESVDETISEDLQDLALLNRQEILARSQNLQEDLLKEMEEIKAKATSQRDEQNALKASLLERKEKLKELMKTNPKDALETIRNEDINQKITRPTQNCIEELVSEEGMLQIVHADYEDYSDDIVTLVTDADERIILHVTDELQKNLLEATRVRVTGYKLDNEMLVDAADEESVEVSELAGDELAENAAWPVPSGAKKVAVILTNSSVGRDQALSFFRNTVSSYFQQSSYGKMSISPTVYTVSVNTSCSARAWNESVKAAMSQARITESQFDNIQVIGDFAGCGWSGVAYMPGKTSAVKTKSAFGMTTAHELGHNYKADHARFNGNEYGDYYNAMGSTRYQGLIGAPQAEHLGWITSATIATVTRTGTYDIGPIGSTTQGLKALKIPRPNTTPLYIEYRQPNGFDANLRNVSGTNVFTGALLHTIKTRYSSVGTELIDVTPPANVATPALQVGQSYRDSASGATIKVTNRTSSLLSVEVSFPGGGSNPTPTPDRRVSPTPTPPPTTGSTITTSGYLSDKQSSSATIGWGSIRKDRSVEGRQLRLNGKAYSKGIGTHAVSTIRYNINNCSRLTGEVGIDDEVTNSRGRVVFQVLADGQKLYDSGAMTPTTATKAINVSLTGKRTLVLQVNDGGNGIDYDHADWANAYITCSGSTTRLTPTPSTRLHTVSAYSNPPSGLQSLAGYSSRRTGFQVHNTIKLSQISCYGCGRGSRFVLYNSNSSYSFGSIILDKNYTGVNGGWTFVNTPQITLQAGQYYIIRIDPGASPTYYGTTQKNYTDISFQRYSTYTSPTWRTGSFAIQFSYFK